MRLDTAALTRVLAAAPMEFSRVASPSTWKCCSRYRTERWERFRIVESPMISGAVAKERPEWNTYSGQGIDDRTATARLSWSNEGFRAYVIGKDGAYFVDPWTKDNREDYISYFKAGADSATAWPAGETQPLAANLNIPTNDVRANLVIVKVGANGQVSFFNNAGDIDLVADIAGCYGPSGP